jgi:hypothetical protein
MSVISGRGEAFPPIIYGYKRKFFTGMLRPYKPSLELTNICGLFNRTPKITIFSPGLKTPTRLASKGGLFRILQELYCSGGFQTRP